MATLTNTQISVTYVGLLKTSANTVLTSTAQQITDGDGNNSIMFLSTAGVGIGGSPASGKELDVTGNVQVTGDLIIDNITIDGSTITNASGDLTIVNTADNGSVIFQSDDASGGVETYFFLDGGNTSSNPITIFPDNSRLAFGGSQDLEIYHDGSNSFISDQGTGKIKVLTSQFDIINAGNSEFMAEFIQDAEVRLYHNNSKKFETTSTGITVTGVAVTDGLDLGDNEKIRLGSSQDLEIFHDGSNSIIKDAGAGNLQLNATSFVLNNSADSANMIIAVDGGSVSLYHSGNKKLETTSTGVQVQSTGTATFTLLDADDSSEVSINHNASVTTLVYSDLIFDNGGGNNVLQLTNSISALENITVPDSKKIILGTGNDLQIYHDGSNSYIQDTGTGGLRITSDVLRILDTTNAEVMIKAEANAGVELYHDNSKKFETTSTGVSVTGDGLISGDLGIGSTGIFASSVSLNIDGTGLAIKNNVSGSSNNWSIIKNSATSSSANLEFVTGGGTSLTLNHDMSATFAGNISLADSKELIFGNGSDLKITHNGVNTEFNNYNGGVNFVQHQADGDIIFYADDGSGSATEYLRLDGGNTNMVASKTILYNDSVKASFGNAEDLKIKHDGTDSFIENTTGDLTIQNGADDKDIIFSSDDGSGGTTEYFRLDGSITSMVASKDIVFNDSVRAEFGSAGDFDIYHDGTDSFLSNDTGDLTIVNNTDDGDIVFKSDNGSGGTQTYFSLDGSAEQVVFEKSAKFTDNDKILVGTGEDLQIYHDGSNSFINEQGTGDLYIQTNGTNMFLRDSASGNTFIAMNTGTADVSLKQGGNTKLTTTSTGVTVTGSLSAINTTAPTFDNDTHAGECIFIRSGNSAGSGNAQAVLSFGKADGSSLRSGSAIASIQTDSDADKIGLGFYTSDSSSSSQTMDQRMLLDHSGNLGIGLTSATSPLTIKSNSVSSGTSGIAIQANGSTDDIIRLAEKSGNGGRFHMFDGGVEKIAFYTDGTDNHISAGRLGLGTSSPSTKLHVDGTVRFENLPTSDPSVAGALYNDSGTLKISAG